MSRQELPDKQPDRIARMFDAIAPRYDLLNHTLSLGLDRRWRLRAIRTLDAAAPGVLLDVCSGTADMALLARRLGRAGRVVGVDFAAAMLARGLRKVVAAGEAAAVALVRGDAASLPVASASVDAVTMAFGIRNVERAEDACREVARALRPGGRLVILEFGVPKVPGISRLYLWYFKYLLPRIGRGVSGHDAAYSYLPASVSAFPSPEAFCSLLRRAGFPDASAVPLSLGIVYLYVGTRVGDTGDAGAEPAAR